MIMMPAAAGAGPRWHLRPAAGVTCRWHDVAGRVPDSGPPIHIGAPFQREFGERYRVDIALVGSRHFGRDRAVALDYALITHFHTDHIGMLLRSSPLSATGAYQLTGITEVADLVPIKTLVDRAALDHHGNRDTMNGNILRGLRPRVIVQQNWLSDQPGEEVVARLASHEFYPGPRDVFATGMAPEPGQPSGRSWTRSIGVIAGTS
jgi:hypothetical protein